jgi:hypothetical protein
MTNDTALLEAIFQKANPVLAGQSSTDYYDFYGYPISVTTGALERLGLAEHDKQSDFRVKLTTRFMRMIADRGVHRPKSSVKTTTPNDRCLIASIFNIELDDEDSEDGMTGEAIQFGCQVLAVLGLLNSTADQGWRPTRLMQQLMFERCLLQCAKEN